MNVGRSVQKAIDEFMAGDAESSMMHACNAVDGTSKKHYQNIFKSKQRFLTILRDNYSILGPMGAPGLDLSKCTFAIKIDPTSAKVDTLDMAEIIYLVHRCTHGHGDEIPQGFQLLPAANVTTSYTKMSFTPNAVALSDRIIFAMLAIAVFSKVNIGQTVRDGTYLTCGSEKMVINEWWGRRKDFLSIVAQAPPAHGKLSGPWKQIGPSSFELVSSA